MIHWFEALRSDRESFDSEPDFENDSVAQTRGSNPARGGWLVTNVTKTPPYRSERRPDTVAGDICRVLPCSASFSPASGSSKIGPLPLRSERSTIWANSPLESEGVEYVDKYRFPIRPLHTLTRPPFWNGQFEVFKDIQAYNLLLKTHTVNTLKGSQTVPKMKDGLCMAAHYKQSLMRHLRIYVYGWVPLFKP